MVICLIILNKIVLFKACFSVAFNFIKFISQQVVYAFPCMNNSVFNITNFVNQKTTFSCKPKNVYIRKRCCVKNVDIKIEKNIENTLYLFSVIEINSNV